jgi:hypothetical protein
MTTSGEKTCRHRGEPMVVEMAVDTANATLVET